MNTAQSKDDLLTDEPSNNSSIDNAEQAHNNNLQLSTSGGYKKVMKDPMNHIRGLVSRLKRQKKEQTGEKMVSGIIVPEPGTKIVVQQTETAASVPPPPSMGDPIERPYVPAAHHVNAKQVRKRIIKSTEQLAALRDKKYPFVFDSHFHIENYRQQGVSVAAFLNMMDNVGVSKAVLFGLPLRQTVLFDEQQGGHYYTDSDLPLYYFSGTDYYIAEQYSQLTNGDKDKLYPMITGINPVDVGAVDDIVRLLQLYPKTFVGIGEITVHKEIVTAKIAGEKPALYSEGLNNIFEFAGRSGLVCLLHNDIDTMMAKDDEEMPRYFDTLHQFFLKHKHTRIIWAHCGLGRYVTFDDKYIPLLDKLLESCPNVHLDIAWDEVAKYIVRNSQSIKDWSAIICKYPDRFLYGSDLIAPSDELYKKTFKQYKPLLDVLPPHIAHGLVYENALRIFDRARKEVYQWTEFNLPTPGIVYEKAENADLPRQIAPATTTADAN